MLDWLVALIPILPLAAALWIGLAMLFDGASREEHERRTSGIALFAAAGSLFAALALVALRLAGRLPEQVVLGRWLASGDYRLDLVFLTDGLSLALALLAALICLLVIRFAVNYMHREPGFHRFFLILTLFAAAMPLLVTGGNAVLTFIGWEVAGLCSYLLIAFFQDRAVAADNATRVFVTVAGVACSATGVASTSAGAAPGAATGDNARSTVASRACGPSAPRPTAAPATTTVATASHLMDTSSEARTSSRPRPAARSNRSRSRCSARSCPRSTPTRTNRSPRRRCSSRRFVCRCC